MSYNIGNNPKLKEECGVFGVFNNSDAEKLTHLALHSLQHRGQEGAGIASVVEDNLKVKKGKGLLSEVFSLQDIQKFEGKHAIGHVRYSTAGTNSLENVQPFLFMHKNRSFSFAHNGNITNAPELKLELEEQGALFTTSSDTEILGHLLIREKGETHDILLKVMDKFVGAFNFVILEKDKLHIVRDKWGFRPLCLGKKDDSWVVASETSALVAIGAEFVRDVERGEIITISDKGIKSSIYDQASKGHLCAMEYIYFARPDSDIEGLNVHQFRKESGKQLAMEQPVDADIVIAIPDSSLSAAAGYSEQSGIPYEMGLVKNRYIARTFIEPTQEMRELAVMKKLTPVLSVIKDKRIIMVDDSIVRGTTIKKIISLLKKAGAKEVHARIASPPIIAPSYYGIDISTYNELIAHNRTPKEIAKIIGADSVGYLSLETLEKLTGPIGLDTCIFTNVYPTEISQKIKDVKNEK